MLSVDWNLKDRSTWLVLLTVANAVASNVWQRDFSAWVPAASILAVGLVAGFVALSKHQYAAAVTTAAAALPPAAAATPTANVSEVLAEVANALLAASATSPAAAPQRPPQPAAAPEAAPVTPTA